MSRSKKNKNSNGVLVAIIIVSLSASAFFLFKSDIFGTENGGRKIRSFWPESSQEPTSTVAEKPPQPQTPQSQTVEEECLPERFDFTWDVLKEGKAVDGFDSGEPVLFPEASEYSSLEGVTCFRGNNYRDSASYGEAEIVNEKLSAAWSVKIGYIDTWTGVGWTGQPSIVKWDEETRQKMNLSSSKKRKQDLKEVIYAALDGKIYFLDLDDGGPTRKPIDVGYPHKGAVSVDPRGYPLLYAGQGIPEKEGKPVPIGYRIFSLIDQKQLFFIDGMDRDAHRRWGAFDAGGLVDARRDTLYVCGENGLLYNIELNTAYDRENGAIAIKPDITKYRYKSPFGTKIGVENSPVIFRNYIYFADNSGLLQCVDLDTLKPVWLRNVDDDTDSTAALEPVSESEAYLYTACELDSQGENGFSYIRKIHALTGKLMWEKAVECSYDSRTNGGALASPVMGKQDIESLVIYNIAKTGLKKNESTLLALDRKTGDEVWRIQLPYYCWSSPVDVYTKAGKSYLIVCDSGGYMRLLEGKTGKELDKLPLGGNIEASPAVYENMVVVGTRGQKIYGIRVE